MDKKVMLFQDLKNMVNQYLDVFFNPDYALEK